MKRNKFNKKNNITITIYILAIFVILTIFELIFFLPKVKQAIRDSAAIELINEAKEKKEDLSFRDYTLFFISMDNNVISFSYRGTKRYNFLHDSFEYQLMSPPLNALKNYCVSFIPQDTKLIGVTSKGKATYLNLSKEILNSDNFPLAYKQLEAQALFINSDAKFFLLVEGKLYNENKELVYEI